MVIKKLIFLTLFLAIGSLLNKSTAQISVNVNIGAQPSWGPSGYDRAEYYYLPDIESYYYVPKRQFIYISNGRWTFSTSLPTRYRDYDLYRGYKVVINSPEPYYNYREDRRRYAKYKSHHSQPIIHYSRSNHYHDHDDDDDDKRYVKYKDRGYRGEGKRGEYHERGHRRGNGHGNRNEDD